MELTLQLLFVLDCLFYGARKGGIALGLLGSIGLVILTFGFELPPGKPPKDSLGEKQVPDAAYYGSGYLSSTQYWRLGTSFGVLFFDTPLSLNNLTKPQ